MTQENKQLLMKDLCARLPYGVKCRLSVKGANVSITEKLDLGGLEHFMFGTMDVLPYLRSMSSMTEQEKDELYTAMDWYGEIDESGNVYTKGQEKVYRETFYEYTDWLNEHHFDYRGLILMGLALEAPEGMYKTEWKMSWNFYPDNFSSYEDYVKYLKEKGFAFLMHLKECTNSFYLARNL